MEHLGYLLGAIAAFVAIFSIANPERFFKGPTKKKKKVGPSYWGNYVDATTEKKEHQCIESIVYPSKDPTLVGSNTYAIGRGVKE